MGKQGMARGMKKRGMIAVVMGMLLNSLPHKMRQDRGE
jgi:hypothetical protein